MAGKTEAVQQQATLNRYLLYILHNKNIIPDVHSFTGTEGISEPSLDRNYYYKMELMELME
ncbi:hypothetical protein ACOYA6_07205 [Leclercia barmai]|uniref:hypothetical protein n=1 Tax=Leclercia barmai TaxID=2785629 RepID=UPI003BB8BBD4